MLGSRGAYGSVIAVVASAGYYTWRVEERKQKQTEVASRRPVVGSIDDLTSDHLKPGDLVVFERDCTALHLPLACHCVLTKLLLKSSSADHVGIVFTDKRTQLPAVLEAVPWEGVRAQTFTKRVGSGEDISVTVLPLELPSSGLKGSGLKGAAAGEEAAPTAEIASGGATGMGWWSKGKVKAGVGTQPAAAAKRAEKARELRERRVADRINSFCEGARNTSKVPTSAKDSVGLVLNALLTAKLLEPEGKLVLTEPGDLADRKVDLKEGARYGEPLPVRSLR